MDKKLPSIMQKIDKAAKFHEKTKGYSAVDVKNAEIMSIAKKNQMKMLPQICFDTDLKETDTCVKIGKEWHIKSPAGKLGYTPEISLAIVPYRPAKFRSIEPMEIKQTRQDGPLTYPGTIVHMWDQKQIGLMPREKEIKSIFTFGLCGCTALALIAKRKSGMWDVMMSHYPPIDSMNQVLGLKKAAMLFDSNVDCFLSKYLVVVVPGEWARGSDGKWIMKPRDGYLSHISALGKAAKVEPIVSSYSESRGIMRYEKFVPDFEVVLNPDKDHATWTSFGDRHIRHEIR
jgi:hypothetical protein